MADITLTVANNSSDSIVTLAIFGLDEAGQPSGDTLGTLPAPLESGTSATVAVAMPECGPAYMRAAYGDGTPIEGPVDLCSTPTMDFND